MVSGAVEDENGVRSRGDLPADFGQVQRQHFGVGVRQDESGRRTARRTDGAEDVGPFVTAVAWGARPGSPPRPDAGQRTLLSDTRFVLKPDFDRLAARRFGDDGGNLIGEVFLKASWTAGSDFGCRGRTDSLTKPSAFNCLPTVRSCITTPNRSSI